MTSSLPRSSPTAQGVEPQALLSLLDALQTHPDIEMHSLMVLRHGYVVAEGWWAPYAAELPHLLYSVSKSFTATAAAFASAEGLLDLDDTVISHFPELDAEVTDERTRSIRLRHLAAMASGHTRDMLAEAFGRDPQDPVRGFLSISPEREPGSVFAYSQPCTYTLGSIIQRTAGQSLTAYLRPRLFDPLGIGPVGWRRTAGFEEGFSGLHARTEDVAKLGQLYLQRGRWGDAQLLSHEWVTEATSVQVANPDQPNPDWQQGYGFQFWRSRHGYRGDGAFGQFCVVLPEQDTVVATTACTEQMQDVLDALWSHLLPGLSAGVDSVGDPGAEPELAARLTGLQLSPCAAGAPVADPARWGREPFTVDTHPQGVPRPPVTSVGVRPDASGWQLHLVEPDNELTVPIGTGEWAVSSPEDRRGDPVPVAASGGLVDPDTLRVELIFLETPHRMDLTCRLPGRTAEVAWRRPPLWDAGIAELHSPREARS